jgi:hypothetical protein
VDELRPVLNLLLFVFLIGAPLWSWIIERLRRARAERERQGQGRAEDKAEAPPSAETMPAGPEVSRENPLAEALRSLLAERRAAVEGEEFPFDPEGGDVPEEAEEGERPVRALLEVAASPAAKAPASGPPPALEVVVRAPSGAERLDRSLFGNPGLSPGAKLVLAFEILGAPKVLRPAQGPLRGGTHRHPFRGRGTAPG